MKITFCKTLSFIIAVIVLSSLCMTAFASELTPYPLRTPWETKLEFKEIAALDGTPSTSSWKNNWINSYCDVVLTTGGSAHSRDGYTDAETGEYVYDNLTGEAGDYYLFVSQEPDSPSRPVVIYFNTDPSAKNQSHSNGGAIFSNAIYDFDVRIQPGKWSNSFSASNNKGTTFVVYGWDITNNKRVVVARMSIDSYDTTSQSWYPTYYDTELGKYKGLPVVRDIENWYKMRMCVDVKNQKVKYYVLDSEGRLVSQSSEQDFVSSCDYAMTAVELSVGSYRNISIDNVRVAKETYVVDEPVISQNETDITASVNVGHNVYSSDGVPTTSPIAVLAAYDENNKLLAFDSDVVEFSGHDVSGISNFTLPPEYKSLDLEINKPQRAYTLKFFLWSNYFDAAPYIIDIN